MERDAEPLTEAETQLLVVLASFRSRYALMMGLTLDAPADRPNLERFGRTWIGRRMVDWGEAFAGVRARGLVAERGGRFELTDAGLAVARVLAAETPLCAYEYENFFPAAAASRAHAEFCERVYGADLCQHGLADVAQLQLLARTLRLSAADRCLDLGCGNGLVTDYLSRLSGATFLGVDISEEAIRQARAIASRSAGRLEFRRGNMNRLRFDEGSFDAVVSVDTLYYVGDVEETVRQMLRVTRPGGRLGIFFTQWVSDAAQTDRLGADATPVGRALERLGVAFTAYGLSEQEADHWARKLAVLEEMRPAFEREGSTWLFEYRYQEARRYAGWDPRLRSRYLYRADAGPPAAG